MVFVNNNIIKHTTPMQQRVQKENEDNLMAEIVKKKKKNSMNYVLSKGKVKYFRVS